MPVMVIDRCVELSMPVMVISRYVELYACDGNWQVRGAVYP